MGLIVENNIPRRLRTEVDPDDQRHSRDKRTRQLQPPRNCPDILDSKISTRAKQNPKRRPELPRHDQGTPDSSRRNLSREDGYRDFLKPHPEAQQEAADNQLRVSLRKAGTKGCEEGEPCGDEDDVAAAEPVVEGVGDPAGTTYSGLADSFLHCLTG